MLDDMLLGYLKKKSEESYQTATTSYPCCVSTLGEFKGSWLYDPHRPQRYIILLESKAINYPIISDSIFCRSRMINSVVSVHNCSLAGGIEIKTGVFFTG